jgi:tight adherence protein C
MSSAGLFIGVVFLVGGIGAVAVAGWTSRSRQSALAYLTEAENHADPVQDEIVPSFGDRVLRPVAQGVTSRARSLFPSTHLDRLHNQLLYAGLSTSLRAEEFATLEVASAVAGLVIGVLLCAVAGGNVKARVFLAIIIVFCSLLGPAAWLSRRVRHRTTKIDRELPDVLDLLTIAVEAGLGLEAAMEAACADFTGPMTEELSRTLQEMSLGLSRVQALENLKARSLSTDLATFVVVLTQADVLGMPIGRVLRSQADEMRNRRRARAREQAAKLPVKILFPLMLFILPPLMIIVMGPAVASIGKVFGF